MSTETDRIYMAASLGLSESGREHFAQTVKSLAESSEAQRQEALLQSFGNYLKDSERDALEALDRAAALGQTIVTLGSENYPTLVAQCYAPPPVLFIRGVWPMPPSPTMAIIGSRNPQSGALDICKRLASELSEAGVTIVSGLAFGVDGAAHRVTAPGRAIAVLGTPLERCYPADHHSLADKIIAEGGALISQFAPGARVYPSNFLERNRIIAGLSHAVVVVQAGDRSGSLATARYALEEGREVLVTPGAALDARYHGSHVLIRQGATLVTSTEECLQALPDELRPFISKQVKSSEFPTWLTALRDAGTMPNEVVRALCPPELDFDTAILTLELQGALERIPGDKLRFVS